VAVAALLPLRLPLPLLQPAGVVVVEE